ncbi:MAG: hypothetical protein K0S98_321 [Propionibacteriaceae bacterium]|jgi:hypothetical protein|nr:hypothetical protein [Propionibacteriaceae bacterium]
MLLVPRQLQRSGMTGSVPYYGGRLTPAQAYAASHPSAQPSGRSAPSKSALAQAPAPAPRTQSAEMAHIDTEAALRQLRDSGVLTTEEYDDLLARTDT